MNKKILIADNDSQILQYYKDFFDALNKFEGSNNFGKFDIHLFKDGQTLIDYFQVEFDYGDRIPLCILNSREPINGIETAS
ncbi:MAG: hypothetical protein JEZ06_14470 [Anaerolineaceae bacterium]|nr:hypothetical protein [Anaerolineaceae bacterium]